MPDFFFEDQLVHAGHPRIAGIDEAGRGPWCGPVVAAAVILDRQAIPDGLNDSKKLTGPRRNALFTALRDHALIGIGQADVAEIERLNILGASLLAMRRAVDALPQPPDAVLVDGNRAPDLPCPAQCVVKGDGRSLSIAAASIVAKVTRDRIMAALALDYPGYGWERNQGYGTKEHQAGLATLGVTPHHRRGFAPIAKILGRNGQ